MLPILYQNNDLIIYSYPLMMGLGWGLSYQVFIASADVEIKFRQFLFWGMFLAAWIGSKLFFYLITKDLNVNVSEISFWTGGGFVFFGGFIGVVVFLSLYKLLKLPISLNTFSAILPALTLGHAVGRIGCFLAGCCFGAETMMWWGVHLHGANRHPTQIIESVGLIIITLLIWRSRSSVKSIVIYLLGYGFLRLWIEALRADVIRGLWGPFTPSQWISLALILVGVLLIFLNKTNRLQNNR